MATEIGEGTWFTFPISAPRLLLTSHGWPRGLLPDALSSYEVVSPFDLEFAPVIPYTKSLLEIAQGQAQLHERGPGCTSAIVTCETLTTRIVVPIYAYLTMHV